MTCLMLKEWQPGGLAVVDSGCDRASWWTGKCVRGRWRQRPDGYAVLSTEVGFEMCVQRALSQARCPSAHCKLRGWRRQKTFGRDRVLLVTLFPSVKSRFLLCCFLRGRLLSGLSFVGLLDKSISPLESLQSSWSPQCQPEGGPFVWALSLVNSTEGCFLLQPPLGCRFPDFPGDPCSVCFPVNTFISAYQSRSRLH